MERMDVFHITWLDSQSIGEWRELDTIDGELEPTHTIGTLIAETDNSVIVALSYDPATDSVHSAKHIPHVAIIDMRLLCSIPMT